LFFHHAHATPEWASRWHTFSIQEVQFITAAIIYKIKEHFSLMTTNYLKTGTESGAETSCLSNIPQTLYSVQYNQRYFSLKRGSGMQRVTQSLVEEGWCYSELSSGMCCRVK
jgi:hypothetical protein